MAETKYLEEYYNNYEEDSRLLSKHCSIEFLTTLRYICKYLKKDMRILEVGAGTGRYSIHFAKQGYQVNSLELIEHNLQILQSKIKKEYHITARQGNALDLSVYKDNTFDITLVLGPLYHLYTKKEKEKAVSEALRVTKKGGIIFLAYLTNDSVILDWGLLMGKLLEGKKSGLVDKNFRCQDKPEELFSMNYINEMEEMIGQFDVKKLHSVATDGMAHHFKEKIDELDDEFFQTWLEYHYSTCERPDLMGYSNHMLYIGRKR